MTIVDKAAAREVAGVSAQFTSPLDAASTLLVVEVVDRTDVVQTTTGDKVARWRVGASHDPARPERNGVDLVGGVGVPNDELSVLRSRDQVPAVDRPMHGVNLGKMSSESSSRPHDNTGEWVDLGSHGAH